ncbi:MAG: hypothetical protein D6762_03065 [Candidatus Neomarinimicrobiota bacterium]|nr:MAG: hypothetical protein D6762_03065 [Candidatus Neomarinimicrobiota bacterium]
MVFLWLFSLPLVMVGTLGCRYAAGGNDDNQVGTPPPATHLDLPARSSEALTGSQLVSLLTPLELEVREQRIGEEILGGNLPSFLRTLIPLSWKDTLAGRVYDIRLEVIADYVAVGSNDDYLLVPMTPLLAQRLADSLKMILPTPKIVDRIWEAAAVKLAPYPIPPSPDMTTVPVFARHNTLVREQRQTVLDEHPLGELVAGHKKDVVLSNRIAAHPDKVVIYGWHQLNGVPIQPLYSGHVIWYADYSHGIRWIRDTCTINGESRRVRDILRDPELYRLFSDESGPMEVTRYSTDPSNYP